MIPKLMYAPTEECDLKKKRFDLQKFLVPKRQKLDFFHSKQMAEQDPPPANNGLL